MLLKDLTSVLEEIAPSRLARMGDEPSWQGSERSGVSKLGVCVDTTEKNLLEAASLGVDAIVAHHGWDGKFPALVHDHKIAIYRCHTNWDRAPEGNSVVLARLFSLAGIEAFNYSAVGDCPSTEAGALLSMAASKLGLSAIRYYGDPKTPVTRLGVMAGSCFGPNFPDEWAELWRRGVHAVFSGDLSQRVGMTFAERGIFAGDIGHSTSELPGMEHMAELLRERVPVPVVMLRDVYQVNCAQIK
jgi:putative NIF3 family GTP cyclohydrolase 1 type 2